MEDKEIILKIKNGEINYFFFIVKRYTNLIFRNIKKKIYNSDDAEDLAQNTFISFYKAINRFDENRPVLPYLYRIAINEMKMYFRSRKEAISLDPNIYLVDDRPLDNNLNLQYQSQLKQLPKDQQQVIKLLIQGFSYQEIADKMKRPINTIRTVIRRVRLKLLKKYEKS